MFNFKMEPRWTSEIGQIMQTNAKEEKKLKLQINRINSAKRVQLDKIDQEMMTLRKQLLDDRKILGTRSDIKKRDEKNGDEEGQKVKIVEPTFAGFQKPDAIDRNGFKTFQERSRQRAIEQQESRPTPSRMRATEKDGNNNFRRKMSDLGMLPPSCSTPSIRGGRRHSIAEINLNDTLLSKICAQTNTSSSPIKKGASGALMTGADVKIDHPRLRQRRGSLPPAMTYERDHSMDLPKIKNMKFQPERGSKLESEKESKMMSHMDMKLANFSRRRRNSLPNFHILPPNRDSMACKERLTAKLMHTKPKPRSAVSRNVTSPTKSSIFGRKFKKNPTPVTEKSDEGKSENEQSDEDDESLSLDRPSLAEANEPGPDEPLSCEQELSFIPKATLKEKMDKFFLEWVDEPEEEPRIDIEELLQEFRKEKEEKQQEKSSDAEKDLEIRCIEKDLPQCSGLESFPVEEEK